MGRRRTEQIAVAVGTRGTHHLLARIQHAPEPRGILSIFQRDGVGLGLDKVEAPEHGAGGDGADDLGAFRGGGGGLGVAVGAGGRGRQRRAERLRRRGRRRSGSAVRSWISRRRGLGRHCGRGASVRCS